jgi:predicted dinucleotide-binding enzyme
LPALLIPELANTTSLGEEVQKALPSARVVKALNTMSHRLMVEPPRVPGEHDAFLCGEDEGAKAAVVELLRTFGWRNFLDLGPISAARGTEGLMPFWLRLMGKFGNPDFNYRIVRAGP